MTQLPPPLRFENPRKYLLYRLIERMKFCCGTIRSGHFLWSLQQSDFDFRLGKLCQSPLSFSSPGGKSRWIDSCEASDERNSQQYNCLGVFQVIWYVVNTDVLSEDGEWNSSNFWERLLKIGLVLLAPQDARRTTHDSPGRPQPLFTFTERLRHLI